MSTCIYQSECFLYLTLTTLKIIDHSIAILQINSIHLSIESNFYFVYIFGSL